MLPHDPLFLLEQRLLYDAGHAAGCLMKSAGEATSVYALSGKLYLSQSGWLLLDVPNALVRGLFQALDMPGVELPPNKDGTLTAHVSVCRPEELAKVKGGGEAITERGKRFRWQLGPIKQVSPAGWKEMSAVFFASVTSPELQTLRKTYGLSPLPERNGESLPFHLTIGVRRRGVVQRNEVSKAAEARGPESEYCPHCDARLERDPYDGTCNACGKAWPNKTAGSNRETTYTSTRGDRTYDTGALMDLVAGRTPESVPLADIKTNRSRRDGFSLKRLADADTSFPGMLGPDGKLWDGRHRTIKQVEQGKTHGLYHRLSDADIEASRIVGMKAANHEHDPARSSHSLDDRGWQEVLGFTRT